MSGPSSPPFLSELRLRGFKCFRDEVVLPFRRLNLLSGINSKGKSTVLQALLLLHQAMTNAEREKGSPASVDHMDLNGRFVRLGTYREVLHRDLPLDEGIRLSFEVTAGNSAAQVQLDGRSGEAQARTIGSIQRTPEYFINGEPVNLQTDEGFSSWMHRLTEEEPWVMRTPDQIFLNLRYVSADRLGPQEFFRWADEENSDGLFVGIRGEHTADVLRRAGLRLEIDQFRRRAEAETPFLLDQASAWLGYVFDGGKLQEGPRSESVLTLQMNSDGSAHYVRPVHMGFGFSYVLPILVAGLVADTGSLLLIENPEAHLHPLAQSRLGEFLAQVAAAGVQVFVESHSEHILNSFRLAVRNRMLAGESLSVLYFRGAEVDPVLRIPVDEGGGIASWPEGFFDQRLHDFQRLFGV